MAGQQKDVEFRIVPSDDGRWHLDGLSQTSAIPPRIDSHRRRSAVAADVDGKTDKCGRTTDLELMLVELKYNKVNNRCFYLLVKNKNF